MRQAALTAEAIRRRKSRTVILRSMAMRLLLSRA